MGYRRAVAVALRKETGEGKLGDVLSSLLENEWSGPTPLHGTEFCATWPASALFGRSGRVFIRARLSQTVHNTLK